MFAPFRTSFFFAEKLSQKKSRGKRTGKDCNVQETIDPVRKSNFVAPEVPGGPKVYVTLDQRTSIRILIDEVKLEWHFLVTTKPGKKGSRYQDM